MVSTFIALIVSICALAATVYQLFLQREHNEKSLRPIGQIDLKDHKQIINVRVINRGLGPMTVTKLIFIWRQEEYYNIENCLVSFDPKTYNHMHISVDNYKTLPPNNSIEVYEKIFYKDSGDEDDERAKFSIRKALAEIVLKVEFQDMYENKYTITRDLRWFARHIDNSETPNDDADLEAEL